MNDVTLSIVIPHYNDTERLARCLTALMPQVSDDVQVVVADNASTEDLSSLRNRWPEVQFVEQPIKGAGPARNAGAEVATGTWLAFLDADCVPDPDWVDTARQVARDGMVFGGPVSVFDETEPPRSGAEAFEAAFAFRIASYLEKGFLPSCQLVMARADYARVGGFRPDVSEDVDWSRRATEAGLTLDVSPDLKIAHPSRQDWAALRKKWLRLTSEGFLTDAQSAMGRAKWAIKALLMPVSAIAHVPRILRHPGMSAGEKGRGLATLLRLRLARMGWMLNQVLTRRA